MLEYYFILFEVRGIGLMTCLSLPNRYQHEEILRILKSQFSYDGYHCLASGNISSGSNGNRQRVLVHEFRSLRDIDPLPKVMRLVLDFFAKTTFRAMEMVRERLSDEEHEDRRHLHEVVFMI